MNCMHSCKCLSESYTTVNSVIVGACLLICFNSVLLDLGQRDQWILSKKTLSSIFKSLVITITTSTSINNAVL